MSIVPLVFRQLAALFVRFRGNTQSTAFHARSQ
jgi:hypothetical protein